jgi:phosphatidylglycerol:prolipoprotein diacylglycerol transferase
MFPNQEYLYTIFLCIGFVAAMLAFNFLSKKLGMSPRAYNFYFNLALVSIAVGILSAILFQVVYDVIGNGFKTAFANYKAGNDPGMTFLGGLAGGIGTFLLGTRLLAKPEVKRDFNIILQIFAPGVCAAHFFGRIGCFCAGCCYGQETHTFLDVVFPAHSNASIDAYNQHLTEGYEAVSRLPAQLIEAAFLFVLFFVCLYICLKFVKKPKETLIVYLFSYGAFRFILEFFRGDYRGWQSFPSPSQILCFLMLIAGGILLYIRLATKKPLFSGSPPAPLEETDPSPSSSSVS